MEEKRPTEKTVPQSPANVLTTTHSKRNLFIILGVAALVVACIVSYASYLLSIQAEKDAMAKKAALTPTVMPTPTPASPSADFVFYDDLSGEEKFSVAYNFSDRVLNAGFAYPPGYSMQSYKAEENDKKAGIFFINKSASQANIVAAVIKCVLSNRKGEVQSGACSEGYLGDVAVRMSVYSPKEPFPQQDDPNCRLEIAQKGRVLFACLSGVDKKGMEYTLYLTRENPIFVKVTAQYPKEQAHLIRSIISSATNHL